MNNKNRKRTFKKCTPRHCSTFLVGTAEHQRKWKFKSSHRQKDRSTTEEHYLAWPTLLKATIKVREQWNIIFNVLKLINLSPEYYTLGSFLSGICEGEIKEFQVKSWNFKWIMNIYIT